MAHALRSRLSVILAALAILGVVGRAPGAQDRITFFYVVNDSGRPARVVATVDGRELFVVDVPAASGAGRSARELKAPLSPTAASLVVANVASGLSTVVDLSRLPQDRTGFRIVVGAGDITVTRDYYPMRSR